MKTKSNSNPAKKQLLPPFLESVDQDRDLQKVNSDLGSTLSFLYRHNGVELKCLLTPEISDRFVQHKPPSDKGRFHVSL